MSEHFFGLTDQEKQEVLEIGAANSGRPPHLLEKDLWVVAILSFLFESHLASDLTFKGGTSLSKAYQAIDRFSEDIDLTLDIRCLIGDLMPGQEALPDSKSQARKWTSAIKERLPVWLSGTALPLLRHTLEQMGLEATLEPGGKEREKLLIHYRPLKVGSGYVAPTVQLEFGARATGEPHQEIGITCDIAGHVPGLLFPTAQPLVMAIERTFWEKATAAHVYCLQERLRGERYARHWYDMAMLAKKGFVAEALAATEIAHMVARHKSLFFAEKSIEGDTIDYIQAVTGALRLVPTGSNLEALKLDYNAMADDGILLGHPLAFDEIMMICADIEHAVNQPHR